MTNDAKIAATAITNSDDEDGRSQQVQQVFDNLTDVEQALQKVVQDHRHGRYGFVTREWGFMAPGGLGGPLGGDFAPWEDKLAQVKDYFWPLEAYAAMEEAPYGKADPHILAKLDLKPHQGEQLYNNLPLHNFLKEPPIPAVVVTEAHLDDYRTTAKIFLLIGTLSHLYGNSAPDPTTCQLPSWIEEPLVQVAQRLEVEPTLSGHFLVQENWIWKAPTTSSSTTNTTVDNDNSNSNNNDKDDILYNQQQDEDVHHKLVKASAKRRDRLIIKTLLLHCQCQDRRYRVKIYPNCFVGSQAIDVLVDKQFADNREEAVRLGRRINQQYHLFHHVTDDHLLMDKYLFYRFSLKWQQRQERLLLAATTKEEDHKEEGSANQMTREDRPSTTKRTTKSLKEVVLTDDELDNDDDDDDDDEIGGDNRKKAVASSVSSSTKTNRLMRPGDFFKGFSRNRETKNRETKKGGRAGSTTNSAESSGGGGGSNTTKSPGSGGKRIEDILRRTGSLTSDEDDDADADAETSELSTVAAGNLQEYAEATIEYLNSAHLSLHDNDNSNIKNSQSALCDYETSGIQETMATIAVMRLIKVKDRTYHLRTYKQCWIGSQMIDLLMKHECAISRKDALALALDINKRFKLFDHVCGHHQLKDAHLFYRFSPRFEAMMKNQSGNGDGKNDQYNELLPGLVRTRSVDSARRSGQAMIDENLRDSFGAKQTASSLGSQDTSYEDMLLEVDDGDEFRFDNIEMLYPAFGHNHEKVNQLVPACMGHALSCLPFCVMDIITTMRNILEAEMNVSDISSVDSYESRRLYDLLYKVAFSLSRCKEEFQQMSTDPAKRTFNSKHISIRQTQPMSNGVVVQGNDEKETLARNFPTFICWTGCWGDISSKTVTVWLLK